MRQVFDANSRTLLRQLKGHKRTVHVARFAQDRLHVLSASDDATVRCAQRDSSVRWVHNECEPSAQRMYAMHWPETLTHDSAPALCLRWVSQRSTQNVRSGIAGAARMASESYAWHALPCLGAQDCNYADTLCKRRCGYGMSVRGSR